MIWTAYHSTEISNRQTEIFSQKHIFYTFVGGTFSLDISIYKSKVLTDKFLGSFFVVVVVGQTHAAYSVNLLILCKIFPLNDIFFSFPKPNAQGT